MIAGRKSGSKGLSAWALIAEKARFSFNSSARTGEEKMTIGRRTMRDLKCMIISSVAFRSVTVR